jgi:hypothetical protein
VTKSRSNSSFVHGAGNNSFSSPEPNRFLLFLQTEVPVSRNHDFHIGERVVMTYPYVGPNDHHGAIVWVTPRSVRIRFDGNEGPVRFFVRNGGWRNEFGRAVSIHKLEQSPSTSLLSSR